MHLAKRMIVIFIIAFGLNFLWEHWHSAFYVHYQGLPITNAILTYTATFDGFFSTILAIPFLTISALRNKVWIGVLIATTYSIGLEMYALETARWSYQATMPIIPLLGVGLTPTIQLGLLFYISCKIAQKV